MSSRNATRLAVAAAVSAGILGLAAFVASAVGVSVLCIPGFLLLGGGGLVAGAIRRRRRRNEADGEALGQLAVACAELERGNPTTAAWAASKAETLAATPRTRNRALITLAWAALGQGYPERAKAALDQVVPSHALDVYCLAAVEAARGRTTLAVQALEVARTAGTLSCDAAKLLVECNLRAFGMERAVLIAWQTRKALGRENCELVVKAAQLAGAHTAAEKLAAALREEAGAKGASLTGQASSAAGSASAR
jgi:hypothetical protein